MGLGDRRTWGALAVGLLVYVALRPAFGLGHELAVAAIARLLHVAVGSGAWEPMVAALPVDPVYTGAAIRLVGGVDVQGLAAAGPVGAWLHAHLASVFLDPLLVRAGAGLSMVAAPGATAIGRGIAGFGADVVLLGIAAAGASWAMRHGRPGMEAVCLLLGAQDLVKHLLQTSAAVGDLEASGLPFAVATIAPTSGPWFTTWLAGLPGVLRTLLVGGTLAFLACGAVWAAFGGWGLLRGTARRPRGDSSGTKRRPAVEGRVARWPAMAAAALVALSPVGALAMGASNWQAPVALPAARVEVAAAQAGALALPEAGPSHVEIRSDGRGGWQYAVNGQPEVMRGMGYNPWYAKLSADQRTRLYDRDFAAMRQAGVNTIEGWFEDQFDEVTLDAANANGIGVLMPFELNQDWNYADPQVRQGILDRVSAWVIRYRDNPAVRMWAPGNEDLHRILFPKWVSQENVPAVRARADAFASFLPVLVDRIHELDPNHPVLYRDAEDKYLPRLKAAFEQTGVSRPWLVYGANVYVLARLQQIVDQWPRQWLGGPLVISEFAPGGVAGSGRAAGFLQDWAAIRSRPNVVLGGLAYAWATNGPEELDRVFGLVDQDGVARDGALAALGTAYRGDAGAGG